MSGHPLHSDFQTASICGNRYSTPETDTVKRRRKRQSKNNDEHATLEQVTTSLFESEYRDWVESGKVGREPRRLTRERTRQLIASGMKKCEAYCKRNGLRLDDLVRRL